MNRILADLTAFARQYMRSKVGAFFTFIFPLLLIVLFGAIYSNQGSASIGLSVQDLDGSPLSQQFIAALNNTTVVKVSMIPNDVDSRSYISDNSLSVALQIPSGFGRDVAAALSPNSTGVVNVTLYGDQTKSTYGIAQGVVSAVAEQMNFVLSGTTRVVSMNYESITAEQLQFLDLIVPGIIGMTVMTTTMYSMTSVCAEYRTRHYFKLLATTTLKKAEWLSSKILWYMISLTISLFLTVAVAVALWNSRTVIEPLSLVFILVGSVLFTSLGMVIGIFIKDAESAVAVANAIGFPMMFLSGSFFPVEVFPTYLQTVATFLPLTYLNNGLRDVMIYGNVNGGLFNLAVCVVVAVVFFLIAARGMSWKER